VIAPSPLMADIVNLHPKRTSDEAERDQNNNGPCVGQDDYCWECEATTNLDICFDCSAVYCTKCASEKKWHNKYLCEGCDKAGCSDCYEDSFYKTIITHCIECREDWREERRARRAELREEGVGEDIDDTNWCRQ
jgi:hypothetical protein